MKTKAKANNKKIKGNVSESSHGSPQKSENHISLFLSLSLPVFDRDFLSLSINKRMWREEREREIVSSSLRQRELQRKKKI